MARHCLRAVREALEPGKGYAFTAELALSDGGKAEVPVTPAELLSLARFPAKALAVAGVLYDLDLGGAVWWRRQVAALLAGGAGETNGRPTAARGSVMSPDDQTPAAGLIGN